MINQQAIIIRWRMVIMQKIPKEHESALLSWIYNTLLIIDRVFNWIFTVLLVIYVYYYIGDHILYLYPTTTLQCVYFLSLTPFPMSAHPTDILLPWKVFVSFHVCYPYPHFYLPRFCVNSFRTFSPPLHTKHDMNSLKIHTISFLFLPTIYLFLPPKKSDIPESRMSKLTTQGFGTYCYPSCPNLLWTAQSLI